MVSLDAITSAANTFKTTFHSFQADFFGYGQAIFFTLLTISIVLKALEYGWTKDITEALPDWIRELIGAGFFWTVMQNLSWLSSLPNTASVIGGKYLPALDPSSIIVKGVVIINTLMKPLADAGLLDTGVAAMVIGVACCAIIMFCMISIAVNIAVTVICIQGLISISPLFLAAGAFKQSLPIARNVIDAVIGNAVKLMGFYLVVYAGNTALDAMSSRIDGAFDPTTSSFDQYSYIISVVALYYAVAKTFPNQIAKLVMGVIHGSREVSAMAAVNAAVNATTKAVETSSARGITPSNASSFTGAGRYGSITDSALTPIPTTMADALANYREIRSASAANTQERQLATKGMAETSSKFNAGNVAGRFRGLANKPDAGGSSSASGAEYIERVNVSRNYREITSVGTINSQTLQSDAKGSIGATVPHPGSAAGAQSGSSHVAEVAKASGNHREITSGDSTNSQGLKSGAKGPVGASAAGAQPGSHVAEATKASGSHSEAASDNSMDSQAAQSAVKGSTGITTHRHGVGSVTDRFIKLSKKNAGRNNGMSIFKDINKLKDSVQVQIEEDNSAADEEQPKNKST